MFSMWFIDTSAGTSNNYMSLLKLVSYIKRQNDQIVKQNEDILKAIKNKQGLLEAAHYELPNLPVNLPIRNLEEVARIEEYLLEDDNLSTLVLHFFRK